jgi:Protein of unknown function (DUF732)
MWARISTLCAAVVIALAAPAVAHADAHDDDFVTNIAGQGITGDPAKLISTAHTVCTASSEESVASSMVPAGLGRMLPMGYVLSSLHLNMGQVYQFMDAARATYCPDPAAAAPPAGPPAAGDPPAVPPAAAPVLAGMPGLPGLAGVSGIPGMGRLSAALGSS